MLDADDADPSQEVVPVGDDRLALPAFLRRMADQLEGVTVPGEAEVRRLGGLFLGAGLPVLRSAHTHSSWLEYRVPVPEHHRVVWYAALLREVTLMQDRGELENFFFVHKEPGVRIRFQVSAVARPSVTEHLSGWLDELSARGLIDAWRGSVYEPEQYIFGGPVSMRSVHRLFTIDSLVWLRHLSADRPPGPAWALSLTLLKSLFGELSVLEQEDRDIWDRLRRQTHRQFHGPEPKNWERVSAGLRRLWCLPAELRPLLQLPEENILDNFRTDVAAECDVWREDYFLMPGARVGVREAAAFFTVFHWNRARLPLDWQTAICESLVLGPLTESKG
ncbi:thiopeptide-type bacteriocin biosynthesis protein [Streptomyces niveus]|uniref:thiopeptide-type bacteriocin biosynthesis protein n=1 Tax=Streptomyces niveus TaxID=193462 RepID=UPI0036962CB3